MRHSFAENIQVSFLLFALVVSVFLAGVVGASSVSVGMQVLEADQSSFPSGQDDAGLSRELSSAQGMDMRGRVTDETLSQKGMFSVFGDVQRNYGRVTLSFVGAEYEVTWVMAILLASFFFGCSLIFSALLFQKYAPKK